MEKEDLEYLTIAFIYLKEKRYIPIHMLDRHVSGLVKLPSHQNYISLFKILENMGLLTFDTSGGNVKVAIITMEGLAFDNFDQALKYYNLDIQKKQEFFQLEIDRAKWDIRLAKWGWLLGIIAGLISGFLSALIFA